LDGLITNDDGTIINGGTISNNGAITSGGTITNNLGGSIVNYSNINNEFHGTITNSGSITNIDTITNNFGATITNKGTIANGDIGTVSNSGTINNLFRIINNFGGTITNNSDGLITNSGDISNYGNILNCGTYNGTPPSDNQIIACTGVEDTVDTVEDTVDDTVDTVEDTVEDTVDTVEDTVDDTVDTVEDTVDDTVDTVEDTVDDTIDTVEDTVDDTVDTVDDTSDESLDLENIPANRISKTDYGSMIINDRKFDPIDITQRKVKLDGEITGYTFGTVVMLIIEKPDGTITEKGFGARQDGTFHEQITLDDTWEPGRYVVKTTYQGEEVGTFSFLIDMERVPEWVKNNAKWWSEGSIGDSDFVSGIQYLIKEKIMIVSGTPPQSIQKDTEAIPSWVKNNAGWWADGLIGENDFVNGIKWLVEKGIIRV